MFWEKHLKTEALSANSFLPNIQVRHLIPKQIISWKSVEEYKIEFLLLWVNYTLSFDIKVKDTISGKPAWSFSEL